MLEQKKITLEIAGIPMPSFVQLMLKQSINEHHYFEITLDIQAVEIYGVEIPEASKDWVGKKVIMDFGGTFLSAWPPWWGFIVPVGHMEI